MKLEASRPQIGNAKKLEVSSHFLTLGSLQKQENDQFSYIISYYIILLSYRLQTNYDHKPTNSGSLCPVWSTG